MPKAQLCIRLDLASGDRIRPGKIALLEAIQAKGSIASAARHLGMCYRREFLKEVRGVEANVAAPWATLRSFILRMDEKDGTFSPTTQKMGT